MSTLRVTNLQSAAGTQNVTQDRLYRGAATVWVNFNGTGTVAIRDSYNVSSITDNGVGDYTLNFQTALANANYAASGTCGGAAGGYVVTEGSSTNTKTTSAFQFRTANFSTIGVDSISISISIFGGY